MQIMAEELNRDNEILETLAGFTGAVGSRFDKIDGRFDKIDEKLVEHDQQLSEIRQQLDRIEHSILEEHSRRIEALERKVGLVA